MTALPHRLDRTVVIQAPRETVFGFFTDNAKWAAWWGAGSTIDPRPGGAIAIRYPNGIEAVGTVIEIDPPEGIVFWFGYPSGKPVRPEASRVTIRLDASPAGTTLTLSHEFEDVVVRDEFVQGWRYQLAVFANVALDLLHQDASVQADRWFAVWAEPDPDARLRALADLAAPDVRFRDRFSLVSGHADLSAHIGAAQHFMPGLRLERRGEARHCQGVLLVDWVAVDADGQARGQGANIFELGADGRITAAVGFRG